MTDVPTPTGTQFSPRPAMRQSPAFYEMCRVSRPPQVGVEVFFGATSAGRSTCSPSDLGPFPSVALLPPGRSRTRGLRPQPDRAVNFATGRGGIKAARSSSFDQGNSRPNIRNAMGGEPIHTRLRRPLSAPSGSAIAAVPSMASSRAPATGAARIRNGHDIWTATYLRSSEGRGDQ